MAVVNESFARVLFPGQDPLGKRVMGAFQKGDWMTVVGVVGDVRQDGLESAAPPQLYRSYLQAGPSVMSLVLLVAGDPFALKSSVQAQVASVDRDQAVFDIQTLEQRLAGTLAPRRINMELMGLFSTVALILACGGIYGVVSYSVGQRTHEIGVRVALGARGRDVLGLIVSRPMRAVLVGSILGLLASLAVARYFSSLPYGVSASDPWLYAGVATFMLAVAFLASYVPSKRALRVDPILALRRE